MAITKFKKFGGRQRKGNINFDTSQLINVQVAIEQITKQGIKGINAELLRTAKKVLKQAKLNVPVLTGALRKSGRIIKPRKGATKTRFEYVTIFGGIFAQGKQPAGKPKMQTRKFVNYAFLIEEKHKTKSKYLERAFDQFVPGLDDRVQAIVNRNIRKVSVG